MYCREEEKVENPEAAEDFSEAAEDSPAVAEDFPAVAEQVVVGNGFTSKSRYLPEIIPAKISTEDCFAIDYELFGSTRN